MNQLKVLKHEKGNVYLLATKRNTRQSISTIREVLISLKPNVVAIEMCLSKLERFASMEKAPSTQDLSLIPQRLKQKALGERIMLNMIREALTYGNRIRGRRAQQQLQQQTQQQQQQQLQQNMPGLSLPAFQVYQLEPRVFRFDEIGREIGVIFGKDVWQLDYYHPKFLANPNADYRVMLAGKPMEDTWQGIANALTHDEVNMIKVYLKNFTKLFVENSTDLSIISHILRRNRRLRAVLVEERNEYMARSLMDAIAIEHRRLRLPQKADFERPPLVKVLAVVKANRLNGIRHSWKKLVEENAKKKLSQGTG